MFCDNTQTLDSDLGDQKSNFSVHDMKVLYFSNKYYPCYLVYYKSSSDFI